MSKTKNAAARAKKLAELKGRLRKEGSSLSDWAVKHGFKPAQVYDVTAGRNKGKFGAGREISEALGIGAPE